MSSFDFGILFPALLAGLLITATHVPLGIEVLRRGIVFIDLAIAQIAVTGVIAADWLGFETHGWAVQIAALAAALAGALVLTWSEKRWPEVQEAVIGVVFIFAASAGILLLAGNPHGGEHLRDLLSGQILWTGFADLTYPALAYALILALWFGAKTRLGGIGFYILFAWAVTISVQLVGLYLVFATLIIPALATRTLLKLRQTCAYALAGAGYLAGLLLSAVSDLPSGAVIVCVMTIIGASVYVCTR